MRKKVLFSALSLVMSAIFAMTFTACSMGNQSIEITKSSITLTVGEQHTLTYVLEPSDLDVEINWGSSDPSIATVDQNGTVTGVSAGETSVFVEAIEKGEPILRSFCGVIVMQEWEVAYKNTWEQTDLTVETSYELTMRDYNDADTVFTVDMQEVVEYDDGAMLYNYSNYEANAFGDKLVENTKNYLYIEDGTTYDYFGLSGDGENYVWIERDTYDADEEIMQSNMVSKAFDKINASFTASNGHQAIIFELADFVEYDNQTKVLKLENVKTFVNLCGYFATEYDADLEISFKDGLVSSYTLHYSAPYIEFDNVRIGLPVEYNAEIAGVEVDCVLTAEVTYGETSVTIPENDLEIVNGFRQTQDLRNALMEIFNCDTGYTMTVEGADVVVEKLEVNGNKITCSKQTNGEFTGYLELEKSEDRNITGYEYYKPEGEWEKVYIPGYDAANMTKTGQIIAHDFYHAAAPSPSTKYLTLLYSYYIFAKGEGNTYTATLTDCVYGEYARCEITVTLDNNGKLSKIELNYGNSANNYFKNAVYTFTDLGSTSVTIPADVKDNAVEVGY